MTKDQDTNDQESPKAIMAKGDWWYCGHSWLLGASFGARQVLGMVRVRGRSFRRQECGRYSRQAQAVAAWSLVSWTLVIPARLSSFQFALFRHIRGPFVPS